MGCQPSKEKQPTEQSVSDVSADQFKMSYKQFIRNDIGQVFQFYHFSKIINRSSTSLIRKVIHRVSKIERICKIVPVQKKQNIHIIKQVEVLKNLDHPNIVQVQEYYFDKTYLYIVMENIQGKRLSQFLASNQNLSLDSLVRIFQQLLSAVNYCHKKGIAHNLIHPDNILIIQKNKHFFLKLIDFSEAAVIRSPKITKGNFTKEFKYFKDPYADNYISQKNDVWSSGMLFLFMISGEKNFEQFEENKMEIIKRYVECFDIEDDTVQRFLDLFMKMFKSDLKQRISIEQILQHEFFNQFREERPKSKHRKKEDHFLSRLMKFKAQNQLESVFWMYTSLNLLSSTQKCQYMTQFCNLDTNKDGRLDKEEIRQGLINTFGIKAEEADQYVIKIFEAIDKDNNEYLQFSQFVMATSLISKHISQEELEKIFKQLDYNHDGCISEEELSHIIGGLDVANMILKQKKKISLKEFKKLMFQIFDQNKKK